MSRIEWSFFLKDLSEQTLVIEADTGHNHEMLQMGLFTFYHSVVILSVTGLNIKLWTPRKKYSISIYKLHNQSLDRTIQWVCRLYPVFYPIRLHRHHWKAQDEHKQLFQLHTLVRDKCSHVWKHQYQCISEWSIISHTSQTNMGHILECDEFDGYPVKPVCHNAELYFP